MLEVDVENDGDTIEVSLHGAATFVKLPVLAEALESLPESRDVRLHVGGVANIDHACLELLNDWQEAYERAGKVHVSWDDVQLRHETERPRWVALSRAMLQKPLRSMPVLRWPADPAGSVPAGGCRW
jgi:ABC-type transporter Mla MlaB component